MGGARPLPVVICYFPEVAECLGYPGNLDYLLGREIGFALEEIQAVLAVDLLKLGQVEVAHLRDCPEDEPEHVARLLVVLGGVEVPAVEAAEPVAANDRLGLLAILRVEGRELLLKLFRHELLHGMISCVLLWEAPFRGLLLALGCLLCRSDGVRLADVPINGFGVLPLSLIIHVVEAVLSEVLPDFQGP